jgi:hypothetical protein
MIHPFTFSLAQALEEAQLQTWLIGGNAVELVVGKHIRDHEDIDILVNQDHAQAACQILERWGFAVVHGSLEDGDVFLSAGRHHRRFGSD